MSTSSAARRALRAALTQAPRGGIAAGCQSVKPIASPISPFFSRKFRAKSRVSINYDSLSQADRNRPISTSASGAFCAMRPQVC
jgi:hypothetical protein